MAKVYSTMRPLLISNLLLLLLTHQENLHNHRLHEKRHLKTLRTYCLEADNARLAYVVMYSQSSMIKSLNHQ